MILFYAGAAIIIITLMVVFPLARRREKELFSLLQLMEDRLLQLKKEMNQLQGDLNTREGAAGSFQGYLHQELALSSRRPPQNHNGGHRFQEVKEMVDQGCDREQIAQDLKLGHRELRLILKMKGWG